MQYVPNEMKDERYWARRRKNNMAAKRSRDARRMKENQVAIRATILEKEVVLNSLNLIIAIYKDTSKKYVIQEWGLMLALTLKIISNAI